MAEASTSSRPLPPHIRQPQPGDGAFLASSTPRPGDGAYLASQSRQNGFGSRQDGSNGNGQRRGGNRGQGGSRQTLSTGSSQPVTNGGDGVERSAFGNGPRGASRNRGQSSNGPIRPRQPRPQAGGGASPPSVKVPQLLPLDPSAATFTPGAAIRASELDRANGEHTATPSTSTSNSATDDSTKKGKKRNPPKKNNAKKRNEGGDSATTSQRNGDGELEKTVPPPQIPVSGRRAAFQQTTKLTTTISRTSADGAAQKEVAKKVEKREKRNKDEPDDLVSRLIRGLKNRPFLECPICFNAITPSQPVWSCLPPDHPPELSTPAALALNPITGSTNSSNHYTACYTPFHIDCIRDWANRSLTEEQERARQAGREGEEIAWRCPGCQKRRPDRVGGYRCFCGRLSHPPTLTSAPHSCGDSCAPRAIPVPALRVKSPLLYLALLITHLLPSNAPLRLRTTPPCRQYVTSCALDHSIAVMPITTVKIFVITAPHAVTAAMTRRMLSVDGEGRRRRSAQDWTIMEKRRHGGANTIVENLAKACTIVVFIPVIRPVILTLSTHCPARDLLPCFLATLVRTALHLSLPAPHPVPRHDHADILVLSQLLVPCDELRERMENGQGEVTCERICKALRNCGRHECGRMCCPLWEQANVEGVFKPRTMSSSVIVATPLFTRRSPVVPLSTARTLALDHHLRVVILRPLTLVTNPSNVLLVLILPPSPALAAKTRPSRMSDVHKIEYLVANRVASF
nr:uncharacterized protein CI109_006724 [Kwoniella shandongensis]KAA5524924.1 hypothetical protein CI109_006724 [Kwoniella shandongensis]